MQYSTMIELYPYQITWANKALNILHHHHYYIDTSKMGTGKTYVALWLCQRLNLPVFVVAPVSVLNVWQKLCKQYNIYMVDAISYAKMRNKNNIYLIRRDIEDVVNGRVVKKVIYTASDTFKHIANKGIMLIFDEFHNLKNESCQNKAASVMIDIVKKSDRSRVGLLSGTPFDREECAISVVKLMGLFNDNSIKDLLNYCLKLDKIKTTDIIRYSWPDVVRVIYRLFVEVIKPAISGQMDMPSIPVKFDVKNGFYNITKKNEYNVALKLLEDAVGYITEYGKINFSQITLSLMELERCKVYDMIRVVKRNLESDRSCKVVLCLNYIENMVTAKESLKEYKPLVLIGSVNNKEREIVIDTFNNDDEYRLLIINPTVGGVGISLHDICGHSPRYMYISPSYRFLDIVQTTGRIYRQGVKSNCTIRIFFGILGNDITEFKLIESLAKKTEVLERTLNKVEIILPGRYPNVFEN